MGGTTTRYRRGAREPLPRAGLCDGAVCEGQRTPAPPSPDCVASLPPTSGPALRRRCLRSLLSCMDWSRDEAVASAERPPVSVAPSLLPLREGRAPSPPARSAPLYAPPTGAQVPSPTSVARHPRLLASFMRPRSP
ncbi:hypothetical protein GQ55_7G064100 [Panicum hallii var. hallii]|uniref:Uncharacterized protein n=1 Tax=Panicum hallii var. hallii TaxID=1504633 RepID=A0A2T7CSR1_9POAL|nr:hypothetical protein GQ55_7G064100 [Panicum hallii var. hallii]